MNEALIGLIVDLSEEEDDEVVLEDVVENKILLDENRDDEDLDVKDLIDDTLLVDEELREEDADVFIEKLVADTSLVNRNCR